MCTNFRYKLAFRKSVHFKEGNGCVQICKINWHFTNLDTPGTGMRVSQIYDIYISISEICDTRDGRNGEWSNSQI